MLQAYQVKGQDSHDGTSSGPVLWGVAWHPSATPEEVVDDSSVMLEQLAWHMCKQAFSKPTEIITMMKSAYKTDTWHCSCVEGRRRAERSQLHLNPELLQKSRGRCPSQKLLLPDFLQETAFAFPVAGLLSNDKGRWGMYTARSFWTSLLPNLLGIRSL